RERSSNSNGPDGNAAPSRMVITLGWLLVTAASTATRSTAKLAVTSVDGASFKAIGSSPSPIPGILLLSSGTPAAVQPSRPATTACLRVEILRKSCTPDDYPPRLVWPLPTMGPAEFASAFASEITQCGVGRGYIAQLILARKGLIFSTTRYAALPGQTAPFDHSYRKTFACAARCDRKAIA